MLMRVRRMRMRLWGMSEVGGLLGWRGKACRFELLAVYEKVGYGLERTFILGAFICIN
jgi:hypothetical protein